MATDKSKRREQILRAAERLFQHYGFGKTTVADIARAAKVGVGTVYLEFPSKEHIASELSLRRYECMLDAMRAAAETSGAFAERLHAVFAAQFDWLLQFAHEGPHGKELIRGACMATDQAHERFRDAQLTLLTDFLRRAIDAGEFSADDPQVTARVLLRLFSSFTSKLGPDIEQTRAEVATASRLLLRGLISRPAPR